MTVNVDDARCVATLVRTAAAYGAQVANRARVVGFLREGERVVGVRVADVEAGGAYEIRARQVVNATGVWTDETQGLIGERGSSLACAAHSPVHSGDHSHLYGAPALAFALHAAADPPGLPQTPSRTPIARALDTLDRHLAATTRHRLERAHARMDRGDGLRTLTAASAGELVGDLCRDPHGRVCLHRRRGVRALGRGRVLRAWHRLPASNACVAGCCARRCDNITYRSASGTSRNR